MFARVSGLGGIRSTPRIVTTHTYRQSHRGRQYHSNEDDPTKEKSIRIFQSLNDKMEDHIQKGGSKEDKEYQNLEKMACRVIDNFPELDKENISASKVNQLSGRVNNFVINKKEIVSDSAKPLKELNVIAEIEKICNEVSPVIPAYDLYKAKDQQEAIVDIIFDNIDQTRVETSARLDQYGEFIKNIHSQLIELKNSPNSELDIKIEVLTKTLEDYTSMKETVNTMNEKVENAPTRKDLVELENKLRAEYEKKIEDVITQLANKADNKKHEKSSSPLIEALKKTHSKYNPIYFEGQQNIWERLIDLLAFWGLSVAVMLIIWKIDKENTGVNLDATNEMLNDIQIDQDKYPIPEAYKEEFGKEIQLIEIKKKEFEDRLEKYTYARNLPPESINEYVDIGLELRKKHGLQGKKSSFTIEGQFEKQLTRLSYGTHDEYQAAREGYEAELTSIRNGLESLAIEQRMLIHAVTVREVSDLINTGKKQGIDVTPQNFKELINLKDSDFEELAVEEENIVEYLVNDMPPMAAATSPKLIVAMEKIEALIDLKKEILVSIKNKAIKNRISKGNIKFNE